MAPEATESGKDEDSDGKMPRLSINGRASKEQGGEDDNVSEEEEEDEEPRLKYASLTKHLRPVYRNGDATSAFLVSGDKMIIGTHNGNVHVLSVPPLGSVRVYHAHTASVSSISISPFPPPLVPQKYDAVKKKAGVREGSPAPSTPKKAQALQSGKDQHQMPVPPTPSNAIYIATSSIDGNVVVASLTDAKDVQKRNFGRPVQAVALSPEYKTDRSYLSGGLAGSLVLTTGGRSGTSSTSTTVGAAAAATGWLGSIGLAASTATDKILHSGEGAISTIKWSLSGDYVTWVNEQGIKIMRSHLRLESGEADFAWKRISHTDHPNRPGWDEMAGIWKAHVQWVDEAGLEIEEQFARFDDALERPIGDMNGNPVKNPTSKRSEKLVVGWSGTIWIINVHPGDKRKGKKAGERKIGRAEIVTILRLDCIISGIALYTPNLLLVLAYISPEEDSSTNAKAAKPGVHRRRNALQPEMRIIDITTKEEVSIADHLTISRYESLSATDYHLGVLPAVRISQKVISQRGRLEAISGATIGGIEAIGGGLWDATMYAPRMLKGNSSVRSGSPGSSKAPSELTTNTSLLSSQATIKDSTHDMPHPSALAHGMKIFIHSPYDCIIATKPTIADHFIWLDEHSMFEDAWNLLERYPEAATTHPDRALDSSTSVLSKAQGSLLDFFEDDVSQKGDGTEDLNSQVSIQKRRVGEKWIQQLVSTEQWAKAGEICGKVLRSSSSWEHWAWIFVEAKKFDELTPFIPSKEQRPPIPGIVYELMLGHYIHKDINYFQELLGRWPPELFDAETIIDAIQTCFKTGEVREDSIQNEELGRDWRILTKCLAKLYLAVGRPRKALGCYIRVQDADSAMDLIASHHLVDAVSDNIPGFILLRVSKEAQESAPISELAAQTLEPIRLLVSEAHHGIVLPEAIVGQLQKRYGMPNPYLFFYFRALWEGDTAPLPPSDTTTTTKTNAPRSFTFARTQAAEERLIVAEGRTLVSDHADLAVILFAEYSRPLLMEFLKSSQSYTLEKASQICARRDYFPELIYLLSKEGRTAEALKLIIDKLNDVSQAIQFAKEQDDVSLWEDLLDYSMNKPRFIRGLLEEVGTAIDPLKLVKRIPLGLEIEGLREGLGRMLKEFEVQESISGGVARVLRGEVNGAMLERGRGMRKGIRFDPLKASVVGKKQGGGGGGGSSGGAKTGQVKAGHCAGCGVAISQLDHRTHLLSFPCSHIYHVSCLLRFNKPPDYEIPAIYSLFDTKPVHAGGIENLASQDINDEGRKGEDGVGGAEVNDDWDILGPAGMGGADRSVAMKVDHAVLLRDVVREMGGCPLEIGRQGEG